MRRTRKQQRVESTGPPCGVIWGAMAADCRIGSRTAHHRATLAVGPARGARTAITGPTKNLLCRARGWEPLPELLQIRRCVEQSRAVPGEGLTIHDFDLRIREGVLNIRGKRILLVERKGFG